METATLTLEQKLEVAYCAPVWLRDEQIKSAIQRVKARIAPHAVRPEPIAVVGFGPSLQDTWEKIREFRYVITCSGAHKFLLEHGIVPTYHVEVDPREHKVGLLGPPHPDVEYLIASTCHPKYFQHLADYNVKLWHIFDPSDEGMRLLPPGEWAVTGGCDAGLRAMTMSAFLGFRALHIFGLDGNTRGEFRHAGEHPYGKQKFATLEYEGKIYGTTPAMLLAAKQTFHELDEMPTVEARFYGEGLIQAMAQHYQRPAQRAEGNIAFAKPELISAAYMALNTQLHQDNLAYGVGGGKYAPTVRKLAESLKTTSLLDYGAGKGYLAKALPFPIWEYDPAVPGKQEAPRPADLVVCTDVLEHIEPDKLLYVLDDLRRCTLKVAYFVVHTKAARKTLPDGRNTHLIQQPRAWWEQQLEKFFAVGKIIEQGPLLHIVAGPKAKKTTVLCA